MVVSAYRVLLGERLYDFFHRKIYDKHSAGLYKLYKKGGKIARNLFPAPILNGSWGDRRAIEERRYITTIEKNPCLTLKQKKEEINDIKAKADKRGRKSGPADTCKLEAIRLSEDCEKILKGLEGKITQA
ncbi:MAG: hypothetical protein JSW73_00360 [Candidatus Woesearchaeota archaeon]|nr:MAG: hypothetical protein JSW73_00360 [Candidatus Woesearchaeota archaeon]